MITSQERPRLVRPIRISAESCPCLKEDIFEPVPPSRTLFPDPAVDWMVARADPPLEGVCAVMKRRREMEGKEGWVERGEKRDGVLEGVGMREGVDM
jgi:hypothetical protein